MILRQLFDEASWTYTYLVADEETREAVLIDPVLDQFERDLTLVAELDLVLKYSLDTHVHANHITANGKLREITNCQTGVAQLSAVDCATLKLKEGDNLFLGKDRINVISTPGHTKGCLSFLIQDHLFSGDSLFIRGCGRTDFQQGDAGQLYDSITQKLFILADNTWVHPGHDYHGRIISTIAEEKQHNPRLKLSRERFIKTMDTLNLSNPKLIMEAVPANQTSGQIVNQ